MSVIRVEQETETSRGWEFRVVVLREGEAPSEHTVRLSWVDYDHWSHGGAPPARVVEAIFRFLDDRNEKPPAAFDAANLRRRYRNFDSEIDQYFGTH